MNGLASPLGAPTISGTNTRRLYWNAAQQLAHATASDARAVGCFIVVPLSALIEIELPPTADCLRPCLWCLASTSVAA